MAAVSVMKAGRVRMIYRLREHPECSPFLFILFPFRRDLRGLPGLSPSAFQNLEMSDASQADQETGRMIQAAFRSESPSVQSVPLQTEMSH